MQTVVIRQSSGLPCLSTASQNISSPLGTFASIVRSFAEQEMPSAVVEMKMLKEMTADRGLFWRCADCDYIVKDKRGMFEHVESKHVGSQGYTCMHCGKHCPSKNALRSHVSRNHPVPKSY